MTGESLTCLIFWASHSCTGEQKNDKNACHHSILQCALYNIDIRKDSPDGQTLQVEAYRVCSHPVV